MKVVESVDEASARKILGGTAIDLFHLDRK
jgi:hypothetical protein